ncbi:MAG: hypothetical protein ABI867_00490 [Kofleriaceae bacterium]
MTRLWIAALVACGASAPRVEAPPVRNPVVVIVGDEPMVLAEPPELDLDEVLIEVDPRDARWPMARPPSVEPHLAIAAIFGTREPWPGLCVARREPRHIDRDDALAYLMAWCQLRDDTRAGRGQLAVLLQAKTAAVAGAARLDLIDQLALERGDEVLDWATRIQLDPGVIDAVIGAYIGHDRRGEARILLAYAHPAYEPASSTCHRMFREYMLREDGDPRLAKILAALQDQAGDPTCRRLAQQIDCPVALARWAHARCTTAACSERAIGFDLDRCSSLLTPPVAMTRAWLLAAVAHWPSQERTTTGWLAHAAIAARGAGEPEADAAVLAALTNAMTALVIWRSAPDDR